VLAATIALQHPLDFGRIDMQMAHLDLSRSNVLVKLDGKGHYTGVLLHDFDTTMLTGQQAGTISTKPSLVLMKEGATIEARHGTSSDGCDLMDD
jgi:hypothetical protein